MGAKNFGLGILDSGYKTVHTQLLFIPDDCIVEKTKRLLKTLEYITAEYPINAIGYEFSVMKNKVGRTIDILSGVIISFCVQKDIFVNPVAVATAKRKLAQNSHAPKDVVHNALNELITIPVKPKTSHEYDALVIALITLEKYQAHQLL